MIYKLKLVSLFCLFFLPSILYADVTASKNLADLLTNVTGVQAQFKQTVSDNKGDVLQQTTGQMTLQRPGKFRWETQTPSKQLLVADGKKVWFYDIDLAQVSVQKQQNTNHNSPAMLLSGSVTSIVRNFIITQQADSFTLKPITKSAFFSSVELDFQHDQLTGMQIADNLGQTTQIVFSHVKNNPDLSDDVFHFTPPKGVDVVTE